MLRYLVIFRSDHHGPSTDATVVDVYAKTRLEAIAIARREMPPAHPWRMVESCEWPEDCTDVNEALARVVGL